MIAVHEAIQRIKQDTETEETIKQMEWFDNAILPILKTYAERTSSILDIERDRETLIQATLRNPVGLDISSESHCLYMAIMSAVHILVDNEDGDPVLVLTFDYLFGGLPKGNGLKRGLFLADAGVRIVELLSPAWDFGREFIVCSSFFIKE
jgi:hypothetical protein